MLVQRDSAGNLIKRVPKRYARLQLTSGAAHPDQVYGTGFKNNETGDLTALALKTGFVGLDSANYPTAYEEGLTGDAIQKALQSGVKRDDLFV